MIKDIIKSYKSDNRGSAIITGLVVSAVLMVLCLSLLLVSYSLFLSTSNATSDMPNKEMIYSAADVIGEEITSQTVDVTSYTVITESTSSNEEQETNETAAVPSALWDVIYKGISTGTWSYYKKGVDGHSDLDSCSKYYQMTAIGSVKLIVQLYWEPPKGWTGDYTQLNGTLLNAVYRLYNNDNEVLVKASKKYILTVVDKQINSETGEDDDNYIVRDTPYKKLQYQDWWYYGFDNADVIFQFNGNESTAQLEIYSNNNIKTEDWAFDFYLDGVSNVTTTNNYHFSVVKLEDGWYRVKSNSNYSKTLWTNHFYVPINLSGTLNPYPKVRQKNTGGQAQQSGATTHFVEQQIDLQFDEVTTEDWSSIHSYTHHITFTNNLDKTVTNWTMEFDFPDAINSYQGTADEVEVNGQHYKIKDRGNYVFDPMEPGKSFTVTFSGAGEGYNAGPSNIKIYTVVQTEVSNDTVTITTWKWNPIG